MARHPELRRTRGAWSALTGAALVGMLALTGCSAPAAPPTPVPSSSSTAPSAAASPSATEEPAATLVPDGTADDNLPLFSAVVAEVWATPERGAGRAYIDALTAAGFDKGAMQVTYDESTVGNPAESIQFSVKWSAECLIGQVGPATGEPVTVVVPVLAEGTCLVGATRPIDW